MEPGSPLDCVDLTLLAAAARERSWSAALGLLGLEATEGNVRAFRLRARACGIEIGHLRWRPGVASMSRDDLIAAVEGATSVHEVLARLGLKAGGQTYDALRRVCGEQSVDLPARVLRPDVTGECVTDDQLRAAYAGARSLADVLRRVGLVPRGANYESVRRRLEGLGLPPAALPGRGWSLGVRGPLSDLLVVGRPTSGTELKRRLLREGIFDAVCSECSGVEWQGAPIPLEIDHINGDHSDNRLENLRLLCPNCHAQTPTYRGRNKRRRRPTLTS
jgi:hypothetical protein